MSIGFFVSACGHVWLLPTNNRLITQCFSLPRRKKKPIFSQVSETFALNIITTLSERLSIEEHTTIVYQVQKHSDFTKSKRNRPILLQRMSE